MAQMVSRGDVYRPAGVVTVDELLQRNTPAPVQPPGENTGEIVSVGSLLRREGRAPHAVDRPVTPRGHQVEADEQDAPATPSAARVVRRSALAAGGLLAAGSLVGAAVLNDATFSGTDDAYAGAWPGQGLLDEAGAASAAAPTATTAPAAVAGELDPGLPPPMSWLPVAFPTGLAGDTSPAAGQAGASAPAGPDPIATAPTGSSGPSGATTPDGPAPAGDDAGSTPRGSGGSVGPGGAGGAVDDTTDTLGGAVESVGEALPDPVGEPAQDLGETVDRPGKALGRTASSVTGSDTAPTSTPAPDEPSGGVLGGVGRVAAGLLAG